jgi:PAS domain S-box-containing protein
MSTRFSSDLALGFRSSPWRSALIGIVVLKAFLSLAIKPSWLPAYSSISYFLLLFLAAGFAIRNVVQNTLGTRPFWVFLAIGDGLWALDQWLYLYYGLGLHIDVPDNSIADPVLFLHIVPLLAAAAALPHRNTSERKAYPATLNFLFLLFFWSFLYGYTVLPYQYLFPNATSYALRFDILYLLENLVLVLAVFFLILRARLPWKSIYLHLLGASGLYVLSSAAANLAIDSGGYVNGKLYGVGMIASACWFVWIPLRARQLTGAVSSATRSDGSPQSLASVWAMLGVVLISIPIVWQLFQRNENPALQALRLVLAIVALVGLASAAFIREYLAKRELASRIGLAHERLRLAMESGKTVGWDWDVKSGQDIFFGDLKTVFGIPSDHYVGRVEDFLRRVHPDDRSQVWKAVNAAKQGRHVYAAEHRILWADGTVRWIATQGNFHYAADGEPERMLGMAVDITERKRVEQALRESEDRYRSLVEALPDAVFVLSKDRIVFVNPSGVRLLGAQRPEQIVGRECSEIVHPDSLASIKRRMLDSLQTGIAAPPMEHLLFALDGSSVEIESAAIPIVWKGSPATEAIVRDIRERKRAQKRLQEYERAVEGLEEMIIVVDREYRYVLANRAYLSNRELAREQVVGRPLAEMLDQGVFETVVRERLDECFQGKVVTYEKKSKYPKLGERDLVVSYFPVEGPDGVDRAACVFHDITERKRAEEALQRSEAEARARAEELAVIWDTVPGIALITRDSDSHRITGSRAAYEMLRLPYGANISQSAPEGERPSNHRIVKDGRELAVDELPLEKAMATEQQVRGFEFTLLFNDGASYDIFGNAAPLLDREGTVRGAVGVLVDISERKRAEQSLRLFRTLVDESNDAIYVVDPETLLVLDVNGRSCKDLGYSREQLLSMSIRDIDPDVDTCAEIRDESRNSGSIIFEARHQRKDGSMFPVEVSSKQVHLDRSYRVSVARDITERRRAETALRRSEESYRNFVSQSSEGIFRQDLDAPIAVDLPEDELVRHILYDSYMAECNDAMVKMYGLASPQEFIGKRLTEMLDPNDPHNIELTRDYVRSGFRILDRESHEVDILGNPKVFLNSLIGIVENGKLLRTWGIQRDVTERVRLERAGKQSEQALQESRAELVRAARIATMGELTASIAHEINQPLAAVATNASAALRWLAAQPPNLDEAREAAFGAVREASRASRVIQRIRTLLKKTLPQLRPVSVNEVIREVLILAHGELVTAGVAVHTKLAADVPTVLGDRVQLQQVLLNLIMNAVDAMIAIRDRPRKLLITSANDAEEVLIQVQDSGQGLDPENVHRIFDSFFTTKAEGTGMGLSISRSIIEAHGGRLRAMPGSPHGAVFQMALPKAGSNE